MDGHKLFFRKSKTKLHRIWKTTESSRNLLRNNIYFTNCTQKTAIAMATNKKRTNIFCSTVGGWYKELKFKDFCVFDFIKLLLFNGVFQNNYFKKHILQKAKLKYTRLKCLCRSLCLIIIEEYVKENSHSQ